MLSLSSVTWNDMEWKWEDLAGKIKHWMILGLRSGETEISGLLRMPFLSICFVSSRDRQLPSWMHFSPLGWLWRTLSWRSEQKRGTDRLEVLPSCWLICLPQVFTEHFYVLGIIVTKYAIMSSKSYNLFFPQSIRLILQTGICILLDV